MYQILDFPEISNRTTRLCLGVLGYLFLENRFKNSEVSFIPSKFIQPFSKKAKGNLIEYLISNQYISKFVPFESHKNQMDEIEKKLNYENYKKKPNLYLISNKLRRLQVIELKDFSIEKRIITNLHFLHQQSFNHWAHNYRYIGIEVPNDQIWQEVIESEYHQKKIRESRQNESFYIDNEMKFKAQFYGDLNYKRYDLRYFGMEDKEYGGRISNIFTISNPVLRNYTTLNEAVEIGVKYSEGVIMADQLLKTIGNNDFTDCFIDDAIAYEEWKEKQEKKGNVVEPKQSSLELYEATDDDLIFIGKPKKRTYYDMHREQIKLAMFGYQHNNFFSKEFPKAWDTIFQIKANVVNEKKGKYEPYREYIFNQFVSNINPKIFLNDWRIQVERPGYIHPDIIEIKRRKQLYYKVVSLVWIHREVEIMRAVWKKLKRKGVICIPLWDSVLVSNRYGSIVESITIQTWREYIDRKIKLFPNIQSCH